jgi:hypothetical protein
MGKSTFRRTPKVSLNLSLGQRPRILDVVINNAESAIQVRAITHTKKGVSQPYPTAD